MKIQYSNNIKSTKDFPPLKNAGLQFAGQHLVSYRPDLPIYLLQTTYKYLFTRYMRDLQSYLTHLITSWSE